VTGPSNVSLWLPCPECGRDAQWNGTRTEAGHGTAYTIGCDCTDSEPALEPEQLPPSGSVGALQALQRYWRRGAA
jgi:hypothetical protein